MSGEGGEEKKEDESKKTLGEKVKETLYEWIMVSTSHGLPGVFRNKIYAIKIMWLLCFLASTGYCLYSVYTSIVAYFEYPVNTQIIEVYENPTQFPMITMCNINPYVSTAGTTFVRQTLSDNAIIDVISSPALKEFFTYNKSQTTANLYSARTLLMHNAMNQNDTYRSTFGYSQDSFIISCMFNGFLGELTEMSRIYHPTYGNCYQFNSGKNINNSAIDVKYTYKTGKKYGLIITLYIYTPSEVNNI